MSTHITKRYRHSSLRRLSPNRRKNSNRLEIYAGVITISDKGFRGEREDKSGQEIISMLKNAGIDVACIKIIPDEKYQIKETLIDFADKKNIPLILTTGGTGVSPRDVTPDATLEVIDKEVPGHAGH